MTASRLISEVPIGERGKFAGYIRLPYSSNLSAYGWKPIPVSVLSGGSGPVVLLTAGVHGDEYEGQLAMAKFLAETQPEHLEGTVVVLPAVNAPAVKAGSRLSPLDGMNLNRCFPGDPEGSPTEMLAHFLENILIPQSDFIIDLHSGGNSLLHLPCSLMRLSPDLVRRAELVRAVKEFGAPICLVKAGQPGEEGLMDRGIAGAAERCGRPLISSELGGGGTVSTIGLSIAEKGIRQVLRSLGVLNDSKGSESQSVRMLELAGSDYFVYASADGVYEPLAQLGDTVRAGDHAARIWFPETLGRPPVVESFQHDGLVVCQRSIGRTQIGDCLYHLATDIDL